MTSRSIARYARQAAAGIAGLALVVILTYTPVSAAQLTGRSVAVGSSQPSAQTSHAFTFSYVSLDHVGSIKFEYCTNSPFFDDTCDAPAGMSLAAASLSEQSGEVGFSVVVANANELVIARAPAAPTPGSSHYVLDGVVNPSTPRQTVYVRVSTHGDGLAADPRIDEGAILFSTTGAFTTQGFVPPYLTFCVGVTVALDCSTATGNAMNLGELSTASASVATSQFSGATNDESGYTTYVHGTTMTAGNQIIPALGLPSPSSPGTSQYGINLVANTVPSVGGNPSGPGSATPLPGYSTQNLFKYVSGEAIAATNLPTEFRVFTVSYIVNVSGAQPVGRYATTMTFTAVASF